MRAIYGFDSPAETPAACASYITVLDHVCWAAVLQRRTSSVFLISDSAKWEVLLTLASRRHSLVFWVTPLTPGEQTLNCNNKPVCIAIVNTADMHQSYLIFRKLFWGNLSAIGVQVRTYHVSSGEWERVLFVLNLNALPKLDVKERCVWVNAYIGTSHSSAGDRKEGLKLYEGQCLLLPLIRQVFPLN